MTTLIDSREGCKDSRKAAKMGWAQSVTPLEESGLVAEEEVKPTPKKKATKKKTTKSKK